MLLITGITTVPVSLSAVVTRSGLPAPQVTTGTLYFFASSIISVAVGDISIIFKPNGLSVSVRILTNSFSTISTGADEAAIIPSPPPLLAAAASFASEIQAIAP